MPHQQKKAPTKKAREMEPHLPSPPPRRVLVQDDNHVFGVTVEMRHLHTVEGDIGNAVLFARVNAGREDGAFGHIPSPKYSKTVSQSQMSISYAALLYMYKGPRENRIL